MKTLLWLDDQRNPFINKEGKVPKGYDKILWARNYGEFIDIVYINGLTDAISFDHDLADEHYTPEEYWEDYEASKAYQESKEYQEKTGMDCAKWLVDYCIEYSVRLPRCHIHSANPVGADNIVSYLTNFVVHQAANDLY